MFEIPLGIGHYRPTMLQKLQSKVFLYNGMEVYLFE
jgi:hypothetical protein